MPKTEAYGSPRSCVATTMSNPRLPPELLDHIFDLLHDTRSALKNCCLVSRSWIPRTRRYLFANIAFGTTKNLRSWKTAFPDPSTSPARYTRCLLVKFPQVIRAADAERGWITTFSQVVHFEVMISGSGVSRPDFSLVPLHGFSPALKSLRGTFANFPPPSISELIRSFPHLQDLAVTTHWSDRNGGFYKPPVAI